MTDHWTPDDIPDLTGKVAVVTGANRGIGYATAYALAAHHATVILACRQTDRGMMAASSLRAEIPDAQARVMEIDLSRLDSIRAFARRFNDTSERLDLLINNAGVLLAPHGTTQDGFEQHFGVNHLGHFALTGLLLDRLLESPGSRIVTVTSLSYTRGRLEDLDAWRDGSGRDTPVRAYARSKLANLLFALELQDRLSGTGTRSLAAHPGGAATSLGRRMEDRCLYRLIQPILATLSQSPAQAAGPILRAATDPTAACGELYGPSGLMGFRGHPVAVEPRLGRQDRACGRRLWAASEELTGVRFALR